MGSGGETTEPGDRGTAKPRWSSAGTRLAVRGGRTAVPLSCVWYVHEPACPLGVVMERGVGVVGVHAGGAPDSPQRPAAPCCPVLRRRRTSSILAPFECRARASPISAAGARMRRRRTGARTRYGAAPLRARSPGAPRGMWGSSAAEHESTGMSSCPSSPRPSPPPPPPRPPRAARGSGGQAASRPA